MIKNGNLRGSSELVGCERERPRQSSGRVQFATSLSPVNGLPLVLFPKAGAQEVSVGKAGAVGCEQEAGEGPAKFRTKRDCLTGAGKPQEIRNKGCRFSSAVCCAAARPGPVPQQEAVEHPKTWVWCAEMARLRQETQGWGSAASPGNVLWAWACRCSRNETPL